MKVLQHNEIIQISQPVIDVSQVIPVRLQMKELCHQKLGIYHGGRAIAHCQVEKKNPLTFFVMADGTAIINPVILKVNEKTLCYHDEGCMSFMHKKPISVQRYREIWVDYDLYDGNSFQHIFNKKIKELRAFIFQHEIDHFNLKYIY